MVNVLDFGGDQDYDGAGSFNWSVLTFDHLVDNRKTSELIAAEVLGVHQALAAAQAAEETR